MRDVIIIGGGPAGLSAGIYTSRARKNTLIIDRGDCTACKIDRIDNYLGFPKGISGEQLIHRGRRQARRFGCEIIFQEALGVKQEKEDRFLVETEKNSFETKSLILTTGLVHKRANIESLDRYQGKGVSFCVQCDGFFFQDKRVAVIGSRNFAGKELVELSDYTDRIILLTNGEKLEMDEKFLKWIREHRIPVRGERILRAVGDKFLEGLELDNGELVKSEGVFMAIGSSGAVDLARQMGVAVEGSFINVDKRQRTNAPFVYAAGDCTGGNRQISIAMGEGANAATNLLMDLKKI